MAEDTELKGIDKLENKHREQRMANRAFNIWVIKMIWKVVKGEFGEPVVSGEFDPNNMYKSLKLSKEKMRQIEHRASSTFNYDGVIKHASDVRLKTGIPIEYLTGEKIIKLPEFDYDEKAILETYYDKDYYDEKKENIRENLGGKSKEEIKWLAEKAKRLEEKHRKQMMAQIEELNTLRKKIKEYNEKLKKAVLNLCGMNIGDIRDKGLYSLMHFIKYGKKCDEHSLVTVNDLIKVMGSMGYQKLCQEGTDTLNTYYEELKRQAKIVDAVRVIREEKNI